MSLNLSSAQALVNSLKLGFVKPVSYQVNGVEEINSIKCMTLDLPYGKSTNPQNTFGDRYHMQITHHNGRVDYYRFFIINEENAKNSIIAKLFQIDIAFSNRSKTFFSDEEVSSRIELKNNLLSAEISFPKGEYAGVYKIVWENHQLDHQIFLKVGEQWQTEMKNENGNKWNCNILPDKGLALTEQIQRDEILKMMPDGRIREIIPVKENVATAFVFVAEKTGKYKLTFSNGVKQRKFEVTVFE